MSRPLVTDTPDGSVRPISYELAAKHLAYDPNTGIFTWRVKRGRIRPGDEAGSITYNGYVVIRLLGTVHQAAYLAWLLHYGEWPDGPVAPRPPDPERLFLCDSPGEEIVLRHKARSDLRIRNIVKKTLSSDPAAVAKRTYARRRRRAVNTMHLIPPTTTTANKAMPESALRNVIYDPMTKLWKVYDPRTMVGLHDRVLVDQFEDQAEAEQLARDFLRWVEVVRHHYPKPVTADDTKVRAGPHDPVSLEFLNHNLAYDTASGALLWTQPEWRNSHRADKPLGNARYVSIGIKRYPAHAIVWMLHHGVWPRRGSIGWHNGDHGDNRITNLYLKPKATP